METDKIQYIVAVLEQELYGFELDYIDSIIEMQAITRVPASQKEFLGVINLRGNIIPVMSLRKKFGLFEDEFTDVTRIIIVRPKPESAPVGMVVDEVNEVITLSRSDIDTFAYDKTETNANFNIGVGRYGDDLINLLNIPRLITEGEVSK